MSAPKSYSNNRKEEQYDYDFDKRRQYDKTHQYRKKRGGFLGDLFEFD